MSKYRVLLVDDHAILRMGLRALLEIEADLDIVGEVANAEEALGAVGSLTPEIVITDLAMPGRGGLELLAELQDRCPAIKVLVLSAHSSEEYIRASLARGALGYVLKDSSRAELLQAIRSVARGEQYLCRAVSRHVLSGYLGKSTAPRGVPLVGPVTRREREVLTLVASGHPNKKIAHQLGLSVKTVQKHRQNLMQKLSLHNAAAVTAYAIHHGLISANPAA